MKLIELPHKVCDYTCMVNGLEDLYTARTGNPVPDWFFFYMSGMAGFAYIKSQNAPAPRMVNWGSRPKDQYRLLAEVVGFDWQVIENRSFSFTLRRAIGSIDQGNPAILGVLDMYHLPYYEKFYHRFHIPYHYVLLVGYDEAHRTALVHDCGLPEIVEIPFADLQRAWDVSFPGISRRNTLHLFQFNEKPAPIGSITRRALGKISAFMLQPPVGMLGVPGMRKLARELPAWPQELAPAQFEAALRWLVEFTGSPPMPPMRLLGEAGAPDDHSGARRFFARLLKELAEMDAEPSWAKAAVMFERSGNAIQDLTDLGVDYLFGAADSLEPARALLEAAASFEEQGYRLILEAHHP